MNDTSDPGRLLASSGARPTSTVHAHPTAADKDAAARDGITGAWITRCAVRSPIVGRLYGHVDLDTGHGPLVAPGLRYLVGTFDHRRTVLCGAVVRHYAEFDDLTTHTIAEMRDLARRWRVRDFVPPPTTLKRRRRRVPSWARVRLWSWEPEVELDVSYVGRVSFKHADWARIGPDPEWCVVRCGLRLGHDKQPVTPRANGYWPGSHLSTSSHTNRTTSVSLLM